MIPPALVGLLGASVACRPLAEPPPRALTTVTGDQLVATSADVDALAGVGTIDGSLHVVATELRALALPDLGEVTGELRIWENPRLADVQLPALEAVGEDLSLFDNPRVRSLDGLSGLAQVGGTLRVNRMAGLASLEGLEALTSVGGLYLFHDVDLRSLDGLASLLEIRGDAQLFELFALERAVLPSLERVARLDLFECDALRLLEAPELRELGAFELHNCDGMQDLGWFPSVAELPGELRIQYNAGLTSLDGFPSLRVAHDAVIRFNPALTDVSGLEWELVTGELTVANQASLEVLALPALKDVRELVIVGHEALSGLSLPALARVRGARVVDNPQLPGCVVEGILDEVSPEIVVCHANLEDACDTWCSPSP